MSGVIAIATKKELFRRLKLESGLSGVQVVYNLGRDVGRECVRGGKIEVPVDQAAMRPAAARSLREEFAVINVHVRVEVLGAVDSEAEERAAALVGVIADMVAADPTLAGAVSGLLDLGLTHVEYDTGSAEDETLVGLADLQLLAHTMMT